MTTKPMPTQATPREKPRNAALDRARTFLTVVVLIHHAVIPYTLFGHTDPTFWIGFDAVVLANDSYFMAMFFLLSGLFVWPSLMHRTAKGAFTRDRLLRLGVPFVVGALTVIPVAYYALAPRDSTESFAAFWWRTITVGPWPSGPIWFTWVLLVFGIIAGAIYWRAPDSVGPINRLSQRGFTRPLDFFLIFLAVTALVYVPARVYFGPNEWFALGPLAVQKSRVLLYATYFAFGIGIGAAHFDRGVFGADGALPNQWRGWVVAAAIPYVLLWLLIYLKRDLLGNPSEPPDWYEAAYGLAFAAFSAAMLFAVLAIFLRFNSGGRSVLDPLQQDAYGIFLVHYVYVLWLHYWLFGVDLPAIPKALIAFALTLALSWATSAALRQIPGAKRV